MPTYRYECQTCRNQFEQWQSIHDAALSLHDECGGYVVKVITAVNTYAIGTRGEKTAWADKTDKQWGKDMPAYKRLRAEGYQPTAIDGAHAIEATARDEWQIRTGGKVSVPDHRLAELNEMMADGSTTNWSPVEEVHQRKKATA